MLYLYLANDSLNGFGKVFEDEDNLGTTVIKLVFQFPRSVERVHVHHCVTGAQNSWQYDGILQDVRHHDCDAVTLLQTFGLKPRTHSL